MSFTINLIKRHILCMQLLKILSESDMEFVFYLFFSKKSHVFSFLNEYKTKKEDKHFASINIH